MVEMDEVVWEFVAPGEFWKVACLPNPLTTLRHFRVTVGVS